MRGTITQGKNELIINGDLSTQKGVLFDQVYVKTLGLKAGDRVEYDNRLYFRAFICRKLKE